MATGGMSRFGAEYEKIERGGIPSSTEERLAELLGWGGTTSFFSAQAVDVGADAGVHAVGQVVGLSAGYIRSGYVRTTHVGQGRLRVGVPRWREHSGPPASWAQLRGRALGRLTKQAGLLDADAVVGVQAERRFKRLAEPWAGEGEVVFSGTAVRVDRWRSRTEPPVLSLASVPELWAMLRAGVEPAGIAGGFAGVETLPSTATAMAAWGRRRRSPNIEFEDLTKSMYEARRLAIERLLAEAKGLKADGLVSVKLEVDDSLAQVRRVPTSGSRCTFSRRRCGASVRHGLTSAPSCQCPVAPVAETPDALEGVPESGRERLELNKSGLFTSDLSVNEYLLIEDAGYEPLGLVLGTSIYHIGYQRRRLSGNHEMTVLSQALYHARELAMTRMQEEAADLRSDGIVGVRLQVRGFGGRAHTAEFLAVGTAVRKHNSRATSDRPFTSDLSGQDFWSLCRRGARPVGLVMGSCVYSVMFKTPSRQLLTPLFRNVELPVYTQALYDARELAMSRMQHEAADLSADGIVGVQLTDHKHGWGGGLIEFFAIGTAIVRDSGAPPQNSPAAVIDLSR